MKLSKLLLLIIGFGFSVNAQVIVEEVISTDTVDIFASAREERGENEKSPQIAMLANLMLPGLGHQYIGIKKRAMAYFTTEALLVFGMVFCERHSRRQFDDSRSYAWMYSNTKSKKDGDDIYWKVIGQKHFMTYEEYNNAMNLNAQYDDKYLDNDDLWKWEDESYQKKYNAIRETGTKLHIVSSFFVGAMFLNRIISFIDVRIAAKNETIIGGSPDVNINSYYSISSGDMGVSISSTF